MPRRVVGLACVSSLPADRLTGPEMIGLVEQLTAAGKWVVFTFHKINGDRLSVEKADFVSLLVHLAGNRDRIWCVPFGAAAEAVSLLQAKIPAGLPVSIDE